MRFGISHLCPNHGPLAACGPIEGFKRSSLGFHCNIGNLHTDVCPYFDNLKFVIFDAGGPQCHFITSDLHAGRFPYVQ